MNQRKAKSLRKITKSVAITRDLPEKEYGQNTYRKVAFNLKGEPIPYMVYTQFLVECERKLYKEYKKNSK